MAISNASSGFRPGVCTSTTRPTAPFRVCTKCFIEKELTEFYKDSRGRFGTMAKCKKCHNETMISRHKKNPEALKQASYRWKKNNPEKVKISNSQIKSRRRKAERKLFTVKDWKKMLDRHNNSCAYCGSKGNLTMDHIVPLFRGGRHSIGNIIPACRSCNSSKKSSFIVEWRNK